MNEDKIIYSLSVEDILTVIEDNNLKINLDEKMVKFIEDKANQKLIEANKLLKDSNINYHTPLSWVSITSNYHRFTDQ